MGTPQLNQEVWTNLLTAAKASGVSQFVLDQFFLARTDTTGVNMDATDPSRDQDAR